MNPTPTDPITITLIDGRQYQLRLTLGGLRRIMQACGAKSIQQLMATEGDVVIGRLLYEALPALDRSTMTLEVFEDLLPADLTTLAGVVARLLGGRPQTPVE